MSPRAPSALLLAPQRSDRVVPRVRGDEPGEVRLLEVRPHRIVRAIGHGDRGRRTPRRRAPASHASASSDDTAPGRAARPPGPATGSRARRPRAAWGVAASCGRLMDVNTDGEKKSLGTRESAIQTQTQTCRRTGRRHLVRCLRKLSRGAFVVRREQLRALPSRRGRPAVGHSRGARGRRIFGARTRERAISIASTSSARALSRSAPTRSPSEKHGETEIKVARVDASSFATGAREAAARMSANGATTGEGDVRTLWIGDLVRIPSTRFPRRRPRTRAAARRSRPLSHARPQSRRRRDDISRCRLDALGSRRARLSTRARALITIGSNAVARRRASPRKPARAHLPFPRLGTNNRVTGSRSRTCCRVSRISVRARRFLGNAPSVTRETSPTRA